MFLADYEPSHRRAGSYRGNIQQLRSIPLQNSATLRNGYDYLFPEIKKLYKRLFNGREQLIQLQNCLPFRQMKADPIICNKQILKKDISYRCFDCLIHQGSMICQNCFKKGDHKNHRYRQIKEQGCCDCGNQRILKSSGFCSNHNQNKREKIEIPTDRRIIFQLYIKQLFIWGLKIWSNINSGLGMAFFYHLLKYLCQLNRNSPYYNQLTVSLLFSDKIAIMSQIFQIGLTESPHKEQICSIIFELIQSLMPNNEFKQRLLPVFITAYNEGNIFQVSTFAKLIPILLSDSVLVQNAMRNASETFNPVNRDYNVLTYYQHLMMLRYLKPKAIELFFAPLIKKSILPSKFFQKIQKQCQRMNSNGFFLSTVTQNTQQQFLYYKLFNIIIGATSDKGLLRKIIFNYAKTITECRFKVNKIVLIPQRVFTLALFKYFDFEVEKVDLDELRSILNLDKKDMNQFLINLMNQTLNCLGQFALDLVRNTYFYNYRGLYVKEDSQVVMIDYLSVKIIAFLFINSNQVQQLQNILYEYAHKSINSPISSAQGKKDNFDRWNKIVAILIEIVYSPKVQIINSIFLSNTSRVEKQIANLLAKVVKTRGKINQNQFDSVLKNMLFSQPLNDIILEVVSLNKNSKKYQICQNSIYSASQQINFSLLVSLTHTQLHSFIDIQKQIPVKLQQSQIRLRNSLFSQEFVAPLFQDQFSYIKSLSYDKIATNLIELTNTTLKLNSIFESDSKLAATFIQSYRQFIEHNQMVGQLEENEVLNTTFKNIRVEFCKIVDSGAKKEEKQDQQLKKRKALAKAKKERLMKDRKMVENREKFLGQHETIKEEINQNSKIQLQECLVCKEKERSNKLCYFAKVKINNILVNVFNKQTKHLIFYSCFHMVHLDCFLMHNQYTTSFSCPLCHAACNIVLPHQQGSLEVPQMYELLLSNLRKSLKYQPQNVSFEILTFLAYLNLMNIQSQSLPQRQIRLSRSLSQFVSSNQDKFQSQFRKFEQLSKKLSQTNVIGKCIFLMNQLFYLSLKETMYQVCEEYVLCDHGGYTFEQLSMYLSKFESYRIVKNIIRILNPQVLRLLDWGQNIKEQSSQKIIKFNSLPKTMIQVFQVRDNCKCTKDFNHSGVICVICSQKLCQQCKQIRTHSQRFHHDESIYFKTNTGGFIYDNASIQLHIRSFFVNPLGKIWKHQYPLKQFNLDQQLFAKLCNATKNGNLFYFLSHNFEGLSNRNLADII